MGVSLNQNEKKVCPALHLHNSPEMLNNYVIKTHRDIAKKEREEFERIRKENKTKNKKLLEGLGIGVKKQEPKVEIEHKVIESKGATLLNVKRVIKFTEIGVPFTKTDLAKDLMMQSIVVEEILDFLNRHTNIQFKLEGSRYVRTN